MEGESPNTQETVFPANVQSRVGDQPVSRLSVASLLPGTETVPRGGPTVPPHPSPTSFQVPFFQAGQPLPMWHLTPHTYIDTLSRSFAS